MIVSCVGNLIEIAETKYINLFHHFLPSVLQNKHAQCIQTSSQPLLFPF